MKVHLLLIFLFGILSAFALTEKHEEEDYGLGPKLANRIIRGEEAKKNKYPWMAYIRYNRSPFCGGSFIGTRYVLTAARCFNFVKIAKRVEAENDSEKQMLPSYEVVLGDHYVNTTEPDEEQIFSVDNFLELKPFTNRSGVGLRNDVAVVKLNRQAKLTNFVSAIRLAHSSMRVSTGDKLTVAGWGISKHPYFDAKRGYAILPEKFSNVLRVAQMEVIDREDCANTNYPIDKEGYFYLLGHPVGEDIICTQEIYDQGVTSLGDSGDPLMHYDPITNEWVQVGIRAYIWGRKGENAFSDVAYFHDIIEEMKKELENRKHWTQETPPHHVFKQKI